jgi:hypothetical protein
MFTSLTIQTRTAIHARRQTTVLCYLKGRSLESYKALPTVWKIAFSASKLIHAWNVYTYNLLSLLTSFLLPSLSPFIFITSFLTPFLVSFFLFLPSHSPDYLLSHFPRTFAFFLSSPIKCSLSLSTSFIVLCYGLYGFIPFTDKSSLIVLAGHQANTHLNVPYQLQRFY